MSDEELLKLLQDDEGGGSGRGMSFWEACARSGRAVRLAEEESQGDKDAYAAQRAADFEAKGKEDYFILGRIYHRLHEMDIRGQAPNEAWDARQEAMTKELREALRLFRGYKAAWGTAAEKWGMTDMRSEVPVPETEAGRALVTELFGEVVTGRLDAVGYIADTDAVEARTGLVLPGPGHYILDFKTASKANVMDQYKFQFGSQGQNYILLWNHEHPDTPVKGVIFDQILRHKDIEKDKSFKHFFSSALTADLDYIRNIVRIGKDNYDNNRCNPTVCGSAFAPCRFLTSGKCNGW